MQLVQHMWKMFHTADYATHTSSTCRQLWCCPYGIIEPLENLRHGGMCVSNVVNNVVGENCACLAKHVIAIF